MFQGCGTALVTPFRRDLSLDEETLRRLVRRQMDAGVHFLVPCGTTGENPTLSRAEHLRVVEITVEEARGRVPVVAGAGGSDTRAVAALAREVEALGADGLLTVTPPYNKPTPEGLVAHYREVAAATRLPIVVYNVPGRTGTNVEPATLGRLARIDHVVAVKEASGNISQIASLFVQVPESFAVLSGDDALTIPVVALGGTGIISVVSNVVPGEMARLTDLALAGDFAGARALQRQLQQLMEVMFVESNPGPVKAALGLMGLIEPVYRLPAVPPRPESLARIETILSGLGMLAPATAAKAS
ncbi:MAG TPA: 4-hydroxy-tetrahydrodipicolinate synthase [Thermoanaerobaculia bacterium]|nr:4-hydroxy-tetrahydrodipicolinate synthase [Thermoanaerobaculia bacterium]